jgi:hypothetical protein
MSSQKFLKDYEKAAVTIDLDDKDLVAPVIKKVFAKFLVQEF